MILEQRSDHLRVIKKKSRLQPVTSEQAEADFENIEQLCEAINRLPFIPLDSHMCEVVIPPVIVKKKTTLVITLKNKNNNPVTDGSKELNVLIENIRGGKAIQVGPIRVVENTKHHSLPVDADIT